MQNACSCGFHELDSPQRKWILPLPVDQACHTIDDCLRRYCLHPHEHRGAGKDQSHSCFTHSRFSYAPPILCLQIMRQGQCENQKARLYSIVPGNERFTFGPELHVFKITQRVSSEQVSRGLHSMFKSCFAMTNCIMLCFACFDSNRPRLALVHPKHQSQYSALKRCVEVLLACRFCFQNTCRSTDIWQAAKEEQSTPWRSWWATEVMGRMGTSLHTSDAGNNGSSKITAQ